jgi:hypothetical protein
MREDVFMDVNFSSIYPTYRVQRKIPVQGAKIAMNFRGNARQLEKKKEDEKEMQPENEGIGNIVDVNA